LSRLDWYIARRYLASRKQGRLLSLITWIALGGVTLGVTALVVVISVMNGMQEELRAKILGSNPHVHVLQIGSSLRMDDWEDVIQRVLSVEGVVGATPFIITNVGIQRAGYAQTADVYGVLPNPEGTPVTDLERDLQDGVYSLEPTESGYPPVLVGSRLAERMQLFKGDTLVLMSLENVHTSPMGDLYPTVRKFEMAGAFTTGMYDYDVRNIYTPLAATQDLLGIEGANQVGGIAVRVEDLWEANTVGREIRTAVGPGYRVDSWMMVNQAFFSALRLEEFAMGVILCLIIVVSAFNIVSTLVMVVVDRTREIGILKSMGMTDRRILRVFRLQGLWIGMIGTALGVAAGLVTVWALDRYQFISIPAELYYLDHLPVAVQLADIAIIILVSIGITFLATLYPAARAAGLRPVEAIRHE
jgi:lipoprotein-releasing system permease protein